MKQAVPPAGEARDDYAIFAELAERLGCGKTFSEGLDATGWLSRLYEECRPLNRARGLELPDFETFWRDGLIYLTPLDRPVTMLADFVADPESKPLGTPSGKIEIFSQRIAGFDLDDCPGHATWMAPVEWLGGGLASRYPLHLLTDQPARRLHSQLDASPHSAGGKSNGRELVYMNPADAAQRRLGEGQIVDLFNDRGRCLAAVTISSDIMPGVVRLNTGAWFDPDPETGLEKHGNPNVLTLDVPASACRKAAAPRRALSRSPPLSARFHLSPPFACRTSRHHDHRTERAAQHMRTMWWQTANPAPVTQPLRAASKVDVAIIGAGFTGLTAALHLARRGTRVAVLEAETIGSGASGLNAGFVVPNFAKADPAAVVGKLGEDHGQSLLKMIGGGADRVYATIREHGIACDAEQVGWMHVDHSEKVLGILEHRAEAWQALGSPVRMLDAAEARRRASLRHNAGALINDSGGTLHPLNYAYGLASAGIKAGTSVHEHAPVQAVERSNDGWRLTSGQSTIDADTVLLCTNASEQGAARRLARIVVPLRVYQIATASLDEVEVRRISPERNPVADTRANLFTFRFDRDNRLISGGMSMLPLGAEARMAAMVAGRLQAELGLPRLPAVESICGGIGCNSRGIALTAMLGEVLADAASGTPLEALPIPEASPRSLPFRSFAGAAPSVGIAQARWLDRRQGL